MKAHGGVLKLSNIRPEIFEVFAITKLNRLFDIKDDELDALAAFDSACKRSPPAQRLWQCDRVIPTDAAFARTHAGGVLDQPGSRHWLEQDVFASIWRWKRRW